MAPLVYAELVGSQDPWTAAQLVLHLAQDEWILATLAGHDLHHLRHLQAIAAS